MPTNKLSLMDRVAGFVGTELFPVTKDGRTVAGTTQALAEFVAPLAAPLAPISQETAASAAAAAQQAGIAADEAAQAKAQADIALAQAAISAEKSAISAARAGDAATAAAQAAAYAAAATAAQAAGVIGKDTLANLNADLNHVDGAVAYVLNDPATANNTTYRKFGASGAGSWVVSNASPVSALRAYVDSLLDPSFSRVNYVWALLDSQNNVALAIDAAGHVVFGKGGDIDGRITSNSTRLTTLEGSSPVNDATYARSPYTWALIDAQNRIALAIDAAGHVVFGKGGDIDGRITANSGRLDTLESINQSDLTFSRSGYAYALLDSLGNLAFGIDAAGNLISKGLNLTAASTQIADNTAAIAANRKWITPSKNLAGFGDSLTEFGYLTLVGQNMGRTVFSFGLGGQSAPQIFTRQGGLALLLTVAGNTIPAAGGVSVTALNTAALASSGTLASLPGTLAGVYGTLTRDVNNNYTFTRSAPGGATTCYPETAFMLDTQDHDFWTNIFWAGRNHFNYDQTVSGLEAQKKIVLDAISAGIAFLKPVEKRFVVLGVTTGTQVNERKGTDRHNAILDFNRQAKARWPNNFIDLQPILVNSYDPNQPADIAAFGYEQTPPSLLSDDQHYNAAGKAIIAAAVQNFLTTKGW